MPLVKGNLPEDIRREMQGLVKAGVVEEIELPDVSEIEPVYERMKEMLGYEQPAGAASNSLAQYAGLAILRERGKVGDMMFVTNDERILVNRTMLEAVFGVAIKTVSEIAKLPGVK